jgi:DNA-binding transcriptional MocR family regulator
VIVHVDPADPTPVYEQLRAQVARMVAVGALAPGTQLPTIRQLASDLGLAKGTVAKAYEALLRDGVVESAGRRGTIVRGAADVPTIPTMPRWPGTPSPPDAPSRSRSTSSASIAMRPTRSSTSPSTS